MLRILTLLLCLASTAALAAPVTLTAADGVKIYGDYESPVGPPRGVTVLFHMAESSRAEYAPIVPRLLQMGFATLAIDQRSGGGAFSPRNQTVTGLGRSTGYAEALPDLEAALAFARDHAGKLPVIVVGSSYSAALVFVLAAKHPQEISALMAFSPGEYLQGLGVAASASRLRLPVFITSAANSGEVTVAKAIFAVTTSTDKVQFIPKNGVHGASTLREDRNRAGYAENWAAVEAFLARFR